MKIEIRKNLFAKDDKGNTRAFSPGVYEVGKDIKKESAIRLLDLHLASAVEEKAKKAVKK